MSSREGRAIRQQEVMVVEEEEVVAKAEEEVAAEEAGVGLASTEARTARVQILKERPLR